jgi:hypothetical protein
MTHQFQPRQDVPNPQHRGPQLHYFLHHRKPDEFHGHAHERQKVPGFRIQRGRAIPPVGFLQHGPDHGCARRCADSGCVQGGSGCRACARSGCRATSAPRPDRSRRLLPLPLPLPRWLRPRPWPLRAVWHPLTCGQLSSWRNAWRLSAPNPCRVWTSKANNTLLQSSCWNRLTDR